MTDPDVRPEDALQVAQRALAKYNQFEDVIDEVEELRERLVAVEIFCEELKEDTQYDDLSLDAKIGMVREHVFMKATDTHNNKAALDYKDVKWEVFDGQPGAAHCYKLLRKAAEVDGFKFADPDGGNKQLRVDASRVKQSRSVFPEKNRASGVDG